MFRTPGNALGLRFHVAGFPDLDDSCRLRHNRLYLLPAECRGLPMAMDQFPVSGINSHLRVHVFLLLFLLQDKVSELGNKINRRENPPTDQSINQFLSSNFHRMYGLFQTSFYFGYMALFSGALGIICGTVGYIGTSIFVRKIYSNVKID